MDNMKITKFTDCFRQIINAVILAGIIILCTGMYYCVIKAGIPYQDPPLELQIQYAVNMGIGSILVVEGFLISICGGIVRCLFRRRRRGRYDKKYGT